MTQLFTATYQRFQPEWGVPVRTTVGFPRFPLKYDLAGHWKEVTPERAMLHLPRPAFIEKYRAKLDSTGLDRLMEQAQEFAAAHGDERVVVLCFDDLTKPEKWCHRTIMGEWFADLGVPVTELCAEPKVPVRPPEPALFDL